MKSTTCPAVSMQISRRRGYFESLPAREYLPMFWAPQQLALLAGTGVAERAVEDRELAAEDFHAHVPALCAQVKHNTCPCTVRLTLSSRPCVAMQARMRSCQQMHGDVLTFTILHRAVPRAPASRAPDAGDLPGGRLMGRQPCIWRRQPPW